MATFGILLNSEYPPDRLTAYARKADALGFDALWYGDERFYREPYQGLALCAQVTTRIRLATGVTDPYTRHPALTALAIGTLDELSGGRAILGYGAGRTGFPNMDIALDRPVKRLRESVEIIRRLWAGERVRFEGETVIARDLALEFPTRADIPIYLAADSPRTLQLAGEIGDGVITAHCASPKILQPRLELVRQGQVVAGRREGPAMLARLDVSVARDRDAAVYQGRLRMGRFLWSQYPNVAYLEPHGLALPAELDRRLREAGPFRRTQDLEAFRPFVDAIPEELVWPIGVAGTPGEVRQQIERVLAAGADGIMAFLQVSPGETMESAMELYAEAVGLSGRGA